MYIEHNDNVYVKIWNFVLLLEIVEPFRVSGKSAQGQHLVARDPA